MQQQVEQQRNIKHHTSHWFYRWVRPSLALWLGLMIWIAMPTQPTAATPEPGLASTSIQASSRDGQRSTTPPNVERRSARQTASQTASQTGQSVRGGTMPPDVQRILDRGKLVVALLDQDNPPFFRADAADQLTGLDIDLARAIADQLGVEVEFNRSAKTFDSVIKTVYNAQADLAISKLSRTLSRAKSIRFSSPYLKMRQGLLVNRRKK